MLAPTFRLSAKLGWASAKVAIAAARSFRRIGFSSRWVAEGGDEVSGVEGGSRDRHGGRKQVE
ncbi:hypothetical protein Sa4125_06880 [Aureimonas sp. SA4125]|nr:hypothetical protein Sa4125_06880 [Aureimonas sp. SA4125]